MDIYSSLLLAGLIALASAQGTAPDGVTTPKINTDEGASGASSGFNLSQGGLVAIIVVVVIVCVFGTASTVLYVVAKRRQWKIRESIRRASRRLTGRGAYNHTERKNRRTGMMVGSAKPGVQVVRPPGHKRGLVVDVEKGSVNDKVEHTTRKSWLNIRRG